ncbi:MAG: GNAT family N-acetyltransferase [Candidatus Bathyarchaeota archaeon]|nr:GNAT family N-acetyltransferase [Candidatus Bathyarchaeota archaeon]
MRIVEVNTYHDFLSLRESWNDVLARCDHTVFSTWEWLSTWWKHFGKDKKLLLLLAEENNRIIGIAPLMYSVHTMFGLRRGKIEFIGTPDSDYQNFIIAEKSEDCLKLFINHIRKIREKYDCIDLREIPETAEYLPLIGHFSNNITRIHRCPYLALPKTAENLLKSFGSNVRYDIRRKFRKVENSFKTKWLDYSDTRLFNIGMPLFFELHQKRWTSRRFSGIYADKKMRDFHLDIAQSFSQKGWLGLYLYELSDEPVSTVYGFKYKSRYYAYLTGFDPAYSKYSVGNLTLFNTMIHCINEGITIFDFARGAEEYKDRWTKTARWNYEAVIAKGGAIPKIQHCLYNVYWNQGNRINYFLKIK